jgi:hypothetical protein
MTSRALTYLRVITLVAAALVVLLADDPVVRAASAVQALCVLFSLCLRCVAVRAAGADSDASRGDTR